MPRSLFCLSYKILGILFLLCTSSCSSRNSWVVQKIQTKDKCYCSTKLSHPAKDLTDEIDLELLQLEGITEMFLAIHSRPIPIDLDHPDKTPLTIQVGSDRVSSSVLRHKGGQKFSVLQEDLELILQYLQNEQPVTLILPGYATTIDPVGFVSSYEHFNHPPTFNNPFHLPF